MGSREKEAAAVTISRGDAFVFYSSIKICLGEIGRLVESGRISYQDLSATCAELSCMKGVLERNRD